VPAGPNPQGSVLNPATHTLYVADSKGDNVWVYDAATCSAKVISGCARKPATINVGLGPVVVDLDAATDTIYVANGNTNTVSVINGATCNAETTSGCNASPHTVAVGQAPVDLGVDQATDTVYVADWDEGYGTTISVIDGKTCNGQVSSGCGKTPAYVTVGTGPAGVTVDQATDTVYAATVAKNNAGTLWVINGAICNATVTSGCDQKPPSLKIGAGSSQWDTVMVIDKTNDTLYADNYTDNTMSMIDVATCNAQVTTGCGRMPKTVRAGTGPHPDAFGLNLSTHTIYVANAPTNTLSLLDASTCNATTTSGCARLQSDSLPTGRLPQWVTVNQTTDTLYVPNGDSSNVSVLNGAACNATVQSGCTHPN